MFGRCRVTSITRKRTPQGPYRRSMPRVLGGSWGGGRFLVSKVPLYLNRASAEPGNLVLTYLVSSQSWASPSDMDGCRERIFIEPMTSDRKLQASREGSK